MDCSTIKPVVGCWSKADGSFESVSIHYEYATAASGLPIVKSTRYTKADGGDSGSKNSDIKLLLKQTTKLP